MGFRQHSRSDVHHSAIRVLFSPFTGPAHTSPSQFLTAYAQVQALTLIDTHNLQETAFLSLHAKPASPSPSPHLFHPHIPPSPLYSSSFRRPYSQSDANRDASEPRRRVPVRIQAIRSTKHERGGQGLHGR